MSALQAPDWLKREAAASSKTGKYARGRFEDENATELISSEFVLRGAHSEELNGEYWVDPGVPEVHGRPHFSGTGGCHVYYLDKESPPRWVLNGKFTPHKSRCIASFNTEGGVPLHEVKWDYHAGSASGLSGLKRTLRVKPGFDDLTEPEDPGVGDSAGTDSARATMEPGPSRDDGGVDGAVG